MDVKLPRLGEGADSGTVATIFVKEGDHVKTDQALLELESEKAVATIPSPATGIIGKIHVKEGDEIRVGHLIFSLSEGAASAAPAPKTAQAAALDEEPVAEEAPEPSGETIGVEQSTAESAFPPPASPTIRKLARQLGVDLTHVRGSQRGGRIVLEDLKRYIQRLQKIASAPKPVQGKTAPGPEKPAPVPVDFARWGTVDIKRMTTLRKTISNRMAESWTTIPHVTQFADADITDVLALRKKYQKTYAKAKAHLTVTPIILKSLVATLKNHPKFNSSMDETTDELVFKKYYHIGIAVDTDHGLLVPVIRDVDKKSIVQLSIELQDLAERARQRKISLEEMQGGTFTISNQGGIGGAHFTPIINKPEVAILGIGRASLKPVVASTLLSKSSRRLLMRSMLPLGLSYDHRVIDGADAARFITDFVNELQGFNEKSLRI